MKPAEQFKQWGASVESDGSFVRIQVGGEIVALRPDQAQHFAYYLAGAYLQAAGGRMSSLRPHKMEVVR